MPTRTALTPELSVTVAVIVTCSPRPCGSGESETDVTLGGVESEVCTVTFLTAVMFRLPASSIA